MLQVCSRCAPGRATQECVGEPEICVAAAVVLSAAVRGLPVGWLCVFMCAWCAQGWSLCGVGGINVYPREQPFSALGLWVAA